ncbi:MAG: HD domain-containing protein [Parasporobacterium sp.]|nr:HD domain-containing protein [Parasporobacterium sp.]
MMNKLEEAIIYATVMHQGKVRKFGDTPYILHPLEVAQILATMTDDEEIITAGILHDIVDDTDGTLTEIKKRYGERVAFLVESVSEKKYEGEAPEASWKRRKENSLLVLKNTQDNGVRMVWLADTLADMRSLAGIYSEKGEALWSELHQIDPDMQCWYYRTIAESLELSLNKTGAFKELIKHINSIWPGTFDSEKARYKKYREYSVDGCKVIGRGAKGEVYRYDDELVIKVFNHKNTYHDAEQEIALSRKAFILGIPTAISFGIVSVGDRYGAMYELVDSDTMSRYIAGNPGQVEGYAKIMSELAHTIHSIEVTEEDGFPPVSERLRSYVSGGIAHEDEALADKCLKLLDTLPASDTLVHGDFHTNNIFLQNGEPLLIDMDRVSTGHPLAEISDLYYFYVVLGEDDPSVVENFMGFSYQTAKRFFDFFLEYYLDTKDENRLNEVKEKAALICYIRMVHKIRKKSSLSEDDRKVIGRYMKKAAELAEKTDTLCF